MKNFIVFIMFLIYFSMRSIQIIIENRRSVFMWLLDLMKKFIIFLWEFPQRLLGFIIYFFLQFFYKIGIRYTYKTSYVYTVNVKKPFGVSLGKYIFLSHHYLPSNCDVSNIPVVKHEYGHSIQSLILGPLYLFTAGICSLTQNILSRILYWFGYKKMLLNYYKRWPENWANKLGNVEEKDLLG